MIYLLASRHVLLRACVSCVSVSRRASMTTTKVSEVRAFWRVSVSTILGSVSRNNSDRSKNKSSGRNQLRVASLTKHPLTCTNRPLSLLARQFKSTTVLSLLSGKRQNDRNTANEKVSANSSWSITSRCLRSAFGCCNFISLTY